MIKATKTVIFKIVTVFLIIFSFPNIAKAQNYESQISKVLDEKGLSPSATFAIVEDELGFIWFGTVDGLYRFDGYNFKIYQHQESDTNSLSNNTIRALCLGDDHVLWIGTQGGGLSCLNLVTDQFTNYFNRGKRSNEISGNSVWSVLKDRNGNIWAGVSGVGVDCFDPKTRMFKSYVLIDQEPKTTYETNVRSIFEDKEGNIWMGTDAQGIRVLNPAKNTITSYIHDSKDNSTLSNNSVYGITADIEGNIWISTYGGGVNRYNKSNQSFTHYRYNSQNQNSLVSDLTYRIKRTSFDNYWISTEYGVSLFNPSIGIFTNYSHNKCNTNSISDNRVREIFVDSKGIVWIGSESGVDRMIEQKRFMLYKNDPTNENSIPLGIVRSIFKDNKGNLWIGLIDKGLTKFDKKTGLFHHYKHVPNDQKSIPGNHITAIFQDSENTMWFGEWDHGLIKYDEKNKSFENVASAFSGPDGLTDNRIQLIREAKPGVLWIGTEGGINRFNIKTSKSIHFAHEPNNPNSLSANGVQSNAFIVDKSGNLWVGMWSYGFNKIEFTDSSQTKAIFKSWIHKPDENNTLSNNNVIAMHLTNDSILWIGTFGGGLNRFDLRTETFKHYSPNDGLPNNIIFSILDDVSGNLWLSTDKGISKFNPNTEIFQNFDQDDGLQNDHFFWGSSHKSREGELFFGGIDGLNSFFPDSINKLLNVPKAILLDLKVFNESIKANKSFSWLKEIELKHDQNFLTFEFTGLEYMEPQKSQYLYKLDGIDIKWVDGGGRRFATYTNLSPGYYTFRLNVSNNEEVWSAEQLNFKIHIKPPWWKTNLAISLMILLTISFLWFIYNLRVNILKRQKKNLEIEVVNRTIEVTEKNVMLEMQTQQIIEQKESLNKQRDELYIKNEELQNIVSQLEMAQKALIESEKMASIGILSAGMAHEINNPLNFISVSIYTIREQLTEWNKELINCLDIQKLEDIKSLLAYSETGIERITNIINSLRAYSHKSTDQLSIANINQLVNNTLVLLHSKISHDIQIELNLKEIPDIPCRQDQISQVFINIVDNAIFALNEIAQGEIKLLLIETKVSQFEGNEYVDISFTNSGPDIDDDKIKHIFDPFYTTKSPNIGSGLGLYISYDIIKQHAGILKVRNSDKGVNFTVSLPIHTKVS